MTPLNRRQMAWRAAQDIRDGMVVNLGMGMPVHVADYVPDGVDLFIHSENGVVGAGPLAPAERADPDLVDASSRRITLRPGAAIVDSAWSLAMIRGGHIDVTILGAFEGGPRPPSPARGRGRLVLFPPGCFRGYPAADTSTLRFSARSRWRRTAT